MTQVQDLYECRIVSFLDTMSATLLLYLPPTDTWSIESFLSHSQVEYIPTVCSSSRTCKSCMYIYYMYARPIARQVWKYCVHAVAK